MIRTITESEALTLAVRGDVPGVLDGYAGPVIWGDRTERIALGRAHAGDALVVDDASDALSHWAPTAELRLPLAHPLVQAHLVGWLGRGERCPCGGKPVACCIGCGHYPDDPEVRQPCAGNDAGHTWIDRDCERCNGTGYLRPRHNRYAWLLPEAHGGLPDWIRMALIWGSVVRVAAGMGALTNVFVPPDAHGSRRILSGACRRYPASDAEAFSRGFALLDNAPAGRVIRFEVPE